MRTFRQRLTMIEKRVDHILGSIKEALDINIKALEISATYVERLETLEKQLQDVNSVHKRLIKLEKAQKQEEKKEEHDFICGWGHDFPCHKCGKSLYEINATNASPASA
jgi:phage regulator Rha-like protein